MYRDYTEEPVPAPAPEPSTCPEPGTGTIFVREVEGGNRWASWQAGSAVQDFEGTKLDVMEWARSRPAHARLIFSTEHDDYVPL